MRIAVTGTHGVGKSTLIDDFVSARRDYESVPEPYWLEDDGAAFGDGVSVADLETQLERSCLLILSDKAETDLIFERCPLDFIAYLDVVSAMEGSEWSPTGRQLRQVEKALAALDLIVFIPLRRPDDITVTIELPQLRARVDKRLKAVIRHDDLGLLNETTRVLEVFGTRVARLQMLLDAARPA